MGVRARPSLVERAHELRAVEQVIAGARAGEGGVALLEGPPGIGKSSLLQAASAWTSELTLLRARGSELEVEIPFGVVRQLLEPLVLTMGAGEREALFAGAAALARRVLGQPDLAGGEGREAAARFHGLYWLTADLAAQRPVVLLVDDAHWADISSLRWVLYLAQRLEGLPVAVVLAARPREREEGEELLDALAVLPHVTLLHPRPLSEAGVGRLVGERLGGAADPSFVAACREVTGGVPFLVGELTGELERSGVAPSAGNAGAVRRLSSHSVSRAALARLRRLPPACRALAQAVVILGDGADLRTAADLAEVEVDAARDAADALASAFILAPGRPLAFVHGLVRASVYAEIPLGRRDRWHARAAQVLMAAQAPADRAAVHLLASEPRGDASAVAVLRCAARDARRRGALDVALAALRRAVREPPPEEELGRVHEELGESALQAGEFATAAEHLALAARGLSDPGDRGRAAARLGGALLFCQRTEEAVAVVTEALEDLPGGEHELGLLLQVVRWAAARGSPGAWRSARAAPTRFAAPTDVPATAAQRVWVAELAHQAALEGRAADARALAHQALGDGALLEDPGPGEPLFYPAPLALLFADALEESTAVFSAAMDWARRNGSMFVFSQSAHCRAYAWWVRGALAEAEADAESALQHATYGVRPGVLALLNVRLARGDVAGAELLWAEARMDEQPLEGRTAVGQVQARALLRAATGRRREALEDLRECGRLEAEWAIATPALTSWRSHAAPLLAASGRTQEARDLIADELDRASAFGARRPLGVALRAAGRVHDGAERLAFFEQAADVLAGSEARLDQALALTDLGAELRHGGRRGDARVRLRDAMELARACGADAVSARAHDELVAAGARPRRDPLESRSTLTASELRVARLAAEGLRNREIAQTLFLTEKTIEVHLTSAYRKLDIGSRSQLPRALTSTGA